MRKKRNPIIAADESEQDDGPIGVEQDDGFSIDGVEELTTEDVQDEYDTLTAAEKALIQRSRKRGRAEPAHTGHSTPAQEEEVAQLGPPDDFNWRPTMSLEAPPPKPGMEQRWIRFTAGGVNDPQNWSRAMRGQWSPRKLDTVPKGFNVPASVVQGLGEVVTVGDVILCERDRRIGASRRKYFRDLQKKQMAAAKRHFKAVEREDHPISEYDPDIKPTVGTGRRRPQVQQEEE